MSSLLSRLVTDDVKTRLVKETTRQVQALLDAKSVKITEMKEYGGFRHGSAEPVEADPKRRKR
ncbi:hypothetical protein [Paraburkholderia phenazinium]|uniref:Uncharacterized protein n=1 Tax=Paraburkholderia phenazinium TaxID=60549 RepID=A0A1N6FHN0_9BURK|nr:hypothetical protein [Paraburkholderia phenazinium]SIN94783.1 hypothetical protein SAMN05444168_1579 [Paraburkholderia phenazinium]